MAIAGVYYEVPALIAARSSSSASALSSLNYPGEYGSSKNWAWSANRGIPAANASILALQGYQSYPMQTTPFLAGGASHQVALGGISYFASAGNYELYAMNVETQTEIYDAVLPNAPFTADNVAPFFHIATTQFGGLPRVWVSTPWSGIYGFESVSGKVDFAFNATVPAKGQSGNVGTYSGAAPNFVVDEQRQMVVTGPSVNITGIPGRGFVEGWKLTAQKTTLHYSGTTLTVDTASPSWTTFLSPPQDGSNPQWELAQVNSIPHVWEFDGTSAVDLRTLPAATVQSIVSGDWTAQSGSAVFSAGLEANSSWISEGATDTTYVSTSSPLPVSLSNSFIGPGLFSSSIMALNTTTGSILWTFQVTPHDVWGWGCKGNIAMLPAAISGAQKQVIAKFCENGYLYLLDPATGALLFSGQAPGVARVAGAQIPSVQSQGQMRATLSSITGTSNSQQPALATYGTNVSYDPDNGLLLGAVGIWADHLGGILTSSGAGQFIKGNSTVFAFDLSRLSFAWQSPVRNQELSYIGIANGVGYLATYQGEIYVADTKTGSQLLDIHAAHSVTSLFVMNGVHGKPGLLVIGNSIQTKQQVQTELYTPSSR